MARLDELVAHCDELLEPGRYRDFCPNGLQVPGREEVATIVSGVSAGAELFERAIAEGADVVLVHHGLFWEGTRRSIDRPARRRLQLLFEHDVSLLAYHLPLDGHPEVGNNALLATALGCASAEPAFAQSGATIGMVGRFAGDGIPSQELLARVREAVGRREPLVFPAGPEPVRSIGIVSGGAASFLGEAIDSGLDAFLTGEPAERVMLQAQEAGITLVAAGHYATETHGVRRLGDLLAERFGLRHVFVDVPNPI